MNLYDFIVKNGQGEDISLKDYKGKVLLIVNTATKCGLTPQYKALEAIYRTYHDKGFEILDFPCNQFMKQAPGTDEEIQSFCTLNYHTTFPRFSKIDVNGPDAHPLYVWLKEQIPKDKGNKKSGAFEKMVYLFNRKSAPNDIKWNFGKFLISRQGNVLGRYSPAYAPELLKADIEAELKNIDGL